MLATSLDWSLNERVGRKLKGFNGFIWILAMSLQALGLLESMLFAKEVQLLRELQKNREEALRTLSSGEPTLSTERNLLEDGLELKEVQVLFEIAPSLTRVWRIVLGFLLETGWLFIEFLAFLSLRFKSRSEQGNLPFPSKSVAVAEIIAAVPYVQVMVLMSRRQWDFRLHTANELRPSQIFLLVGLWYVMSFGNIFFFWTLRLSEQKAFLWVYGLVQVLNILVRCFEFLVMLHKRREMNIALQDSEGIAQKDEGRGTVHRVQLFSPRIHHLKHTLMAILAVLYFVDDTDYGESKLGFYDITATAAYFLIYMGDSMWVELLCSEIMALKDRVL